MHFIEGNSPEEITGSISPHCNNDLRLGSAQLGEEFGLIAGEVISGIFIILPSVFPVDVRAIYLSEGRK